MIMECHSTDVRDLAVSLAQRYFEDYTPGAICEYGTIQLDESDIVEFARQYDPQDNHINPSMASRGPFGGLIASGWQTLSVMMRLYFDHYVSDAADLGSPGADEVRWLRPVRPGDSLQLRITVLETRRPRSKPDRGIVRSLVEMLNQNHELVMRLTVISFVRCRHVPDQAYED